MSKTHEWTFQFSAGELHEATHARRVHHENRLEFWRSELEKADTALRARGVEFRDVPMTGGSRVDTVLDPQLAARVSECRSKVAEHTAKRVTFVRWEALFKRSAMRTFDLTVGDVEFFDLLAKP